MSSPIDPIRDLMNRLRAVSDDIGLTLYQGNLTPGQTAADPDVIQAVFLIQPEAVEEPETPKDEEQEKFDAEFEAMMAAQAEAEQAEKQKALGEDIKGWLNE